MAWFSRSPVKAFIDLHERAARAAETLPPFGTRIGDRIVTCHVFNFLDGTARYETKPYYDRAEFHADQKRRWANRTLA